MREDAWERQSPDWRLPPPSPAASSRAGAEGDESLLEWFSRGYLPHREREGLIQHVTVHLADSLPQDVLDRFEVELAHWPEPERDAERRRRLQEWLDAGHGGCALREPMLATMAEKSLLHFHGTRYWLHAWAVMPNHVHALYEPIGDWTLAMIVATWKKYTARQIREHLARFPSARRGAPGSERRPVWHREYWDRFIRDERHYAKAVAYIHHNPDKAGLCPRPELWPWSSARLLAR